MAKVGVTARAVDLDAPHAVAGILLGRDALFVQRRPEAGPSGPGFELGVGAEQVGAAADALIRALALEVIKLTRKRALRPLFAGHGKLLGRELLLPLFLTLDDLLTHLFSFRRALF